MSSSFGQRLRDLREDRGLSLDDLAAKAGISRAYLWRLEKKPDGNPSLELIARLAEGLGTTIGRLLPGTSEHGGETEVEVPPSLAECREQYKLSFEDVQDLARINFRGGHPLRPDDWYQLYLTLNRSVGERDE